MHLYATKKDSKEWDKRPLRKQKFIDKYIFKKLKNNLLKNGYTISKNISGIVEKYPLFDFDFIIENAKNKQKIGFKVYINSIITYPVALNDFQKETGIKVAILSVCTRSKLRKFLNSKILQNLDEKQARVDLFLYMYLKPSKKQNEKLIRKILRLI